MPEIIEYREMVDYTLLKEPIVYLVETKRKPIPEGIICKFCGSDDLVRYGKSKDKQLYRCYDCGRYAHMAALIGMVGRAPIA